MDGPSRRAPLWLKAVVVLLTLGALVSRRPEAFLHPQFFAEDGRIFFLGAHSEGLRSLWVPYAGYFHAYARALALLFSPLPPLVLPALYLVGNVAAVLFAVLRCLSPRLPFALWVRTGMALTLTLAPHENEVFHTLTNAHWILDVVLVLGLLMEAPTTRRETLGDAAVLVVASLSGPFALIFAPLYAMKLLVERTRHAAWQGGLVAVCAALTIPFVESTKRGGPVGAAQLAEAARAIAGVAGRAFVGKWGRPPPELPLSTALLVLGAVLLAVAVLVDAWRSRVWAPVFPLLAAGLVFGAALWAHRGDPGPLTWGAARYLYIPMTCLFWSLLLVAPRNPVGSAAALTVALIAFGAGHRAEPHPDYDWPAAARCLETEARCLVRVPPDEAWAFTVERAAPR